MQLKTLYALLVDELQGLYVAETQVHDAAGRLQKGAHADALQDTLGEVQVKTKENLKRLETIFSKLGENPRGGEADAIRSILVSGEERLGSGGDPRVVDAGVILVARRLKSWQVASYGTLERYALRVGLEEIAGILEESLNEEKAMYARMGELAEQMELKGSREA
jgi:ferritin-like metal-binding protein YciE